MPSETTNICRIFCENCQFGAHYIVQILFAIVLFVTLIIYIQKIKFSYDIKETPWNRSLGNHSVKLGQMFHIENDSSRKHDCDVVKQFCYSDKDCKSVCKQSNYSCINQQCRPKYEPPPSHACEAKKGGLLVKGLDDAPICLCTASIFYQGENCSEKNPLLESMDIDETFDARYSQPSEKFLKCKNSNFQPFKIGNSFHCLAPDIGNRIIF